MGRLFWLFYFTNFFLFLNVLQAVDEPNVRVAFGHFDQVQRLMHFICSVSLHHSLQAN